MAYIHLKQPNILYWLTLEKEKSGDRYFKKHNSNLLNISQNADFLVAGEAVYVARTVAEMLGIHWAFAVLSPASFLSAYDTIFLYFQSTHGCQSCDH